MLAIFLNKNLSFKFFWVYPFLMNSELLRQLFCVYMWPDSSLWHSVPFSYSVLLVFFFFFSYNMLLGISFLVLFVCHLYLDRHLFLSIWEFFSMTLLKIFSIPSSWISSSIFIIYSSFHVSQMFPMLYTLKYFFSLCLTEWYNLT